MPRPKHWLLGVVLVLAGCGDPTGVELPALLQFTLTPGEITATPAEAYVAARHATVLEVAGHVSFTGCSYLVPTVHGTSRDVRLDLTLEPTGGYCTLVPIPRRFVAEIGGIESGRSVRIRVRLRPGDQLLLDAMVPGS
jgi:hypothetical protein